MQAKSKMFLREIPLHLLFWFVVWVFFSSFFSVDVSNSRFVIQFSSSMSVAAIVGSYVMRYQLIPMYLLEKKYGLFVLYVFYLMVFIISIVLLTVLFGFAFYYRLEYTQMPALTKSVSVILVCVFLVITVVSAFTLVSQSYRTLEEKKDLETKFLKTQLQLTTQELKFLKMQIHPHFLFNTLNVLYGFALKKSDKTPEMILKLSNLLDYILYQIEKPIVELLDELKHIEDYIVLEELRFQNTLQVCLKTDLQSSNFQIAPMLLLPFVENSFKHGADLSGSLKIDIYVKTIEELLVFSVKNTCISRDVNAKGIGLENIKKTIRVVVPRGLFT